MVWSEVCASNQNWAQEASSHLRNSRKTSTKTQWTDSEPSVSGGDKGHATWLGFGYFSCSTVAVTVYSPGETLCWASTAIRARTGADSHRSNFLASQSHKFLLAIRLVVTECNRNHHQVVYLPVEVDNTPDLCGTDPSTFKTKLCWSERIMLLQNLAFHLILSVNLLIYTLKNIDPEWWKKITKHTFFFIFTAQNCSIYFLTDVGQYWFKLLSFIPLTYLSIFPYSFPFDL